MLALSIKQKQEFLVFVMQIHTLQTQQKNIIST